MELASLKSQITSNNLQSAYIFSGTEWYTQRLYINQMAKVKQLEVKYIDEMTDIYKALQNKSFISKSYLYVLRDDKDLMSNETLQKRVFSDGNLLGNNLLVLILTKVDKRKKLYTTYKDIIVEFEPLNNATLIRHIKKEIDLSDQNCQKLIDVCESDFGRILLEIDKIKAFIPKCDTDYRDLHSSNVESFSDYCFRLLLEDGTIYRPPKDAIFDFVNAILDRDVNLVYDLFEQCKQVGEASLVMLSVLYNNAKAVLQVQTCESKDISKSTGLTAWQIKCAKEHLNNYRPGELVYMLRLIQQVEVDIKTGKIDEAVAVDYLLANIL